MMDMFDWDNWNQNIKNVLEKGNHWENNFYDNTCRADVKKSKTRIQVNKAIHQIYLLIIRPWIYLLV